jgi:hypothetical protein
MDVPTLRDPISGQAVYEVVSFLPRLQTLRPEEVVVKSPVEIDDQGRLIILSLHGEYHPLVGELLQALYDNGFVRSFNWPKWQRQSIGYYEHPERLDTAKMMTCVKLLTLHARRDRFVDGHFAAMISSGHIARILNRMKKLLESPYAHWAER